MGGTTKGGIVFTPILEIFSPRVHEPNKTSPNLVHNWQSNPYEISKAIQQARFLSGRYRSADLTKYWSRTNKEGYCLADTCINVVESIEHILVFCKAYSDCRQRLYYQWLTTQNTVVHNLVIEALASDTDYLVQFILDCSVLPQVISATQAHGSEIMHILFHLTRSWCFSIHKQRMKNLGRWKCH